MCLKRPTITFAVSAPWKIGPQHPAQRVAVDRPRIHAQRFSPVDGDDGNGIFIAFVHRRIERDVAALPLEEKFLLQHQQMSFDFFAQMTTGLGIEGQAEHAITWKTGAYSFGKISARYFSITSRVIGPTFTPLIVPSAAMNTEVGRPMIE